MLETKRQTRPSGSARAAILADPDAIDGPLIEELRESLDAFEATPERETFMRAGRAADALVDATIGQNVVTSGFAAHGYSLIERFSAWAHLITTAWHESGHCVVAWAVGRMPTRATIVPEKVSDEVVRLGAVYGVIAPSLFGGDDPNRAARESAMVAFAGELADEPFFSNKCAGARARRWFSEHRYEREDFRGSDRHRYASIGWQHSDDPYESERALERWREGAVAVLEQHEVVVERVAVALLQQRELDEAALGELLGPMPGGEQ
jgi:hypothetical protein